jgi:hypothetical protein
MSVVRPTLAREGNVGWTRWPANTISLRRLLTDANRRFVGVSGIRS